jgi:2'-5' RNA ligase
MTLMAVDIALLPPTDIRQFAIQLSARLPREQSQGLLLDDQHLPHVTLTQQFVQETDLEAMCANVAGALDGVQPLRLHSPGAGRSDRTVWLAITRSPEIADLHERLMDALVAFEQPGGGRDAFYGGDARPGDVQWVAGYRRNSAYPAYTPHITLGHADTLPTIEPFDFTVDVLAACQLGRFCTCRNTLKSWRL